jgi:hypothetical protein
MPGVPSFKDLPVGKMQQQRRGLRYRCHLPGHGSMQHR